MRVLIAIDGVGATGKSTLAAALSRELQDCPIIGVDYFCHSPSGKSGEWWGGNVEGYGVDWERLRDQVLIPASKGGPVRFQSLDWGDWSLTWVDVPDHPYLIVEGMTSLRREVRDFYDVKIWMDAPGETQLARVRERDGDHMINHWHREFIPLAASYCLDHSPRDAADLILDMGEGPEKVLQFLSALELTRNEAHLEQLVLEGLNSGPAVPVTEEYWSRLQERIDSRAAGQRKD